MEAAPYTSCFCEVEMPATSSEENALMEQEAKFDALKELLELDLEETNPSQSKISNVSSKLTRYEEQFLSLKVAYKKYRKRIVASLPSEAQFTDSDTYPYNDSWIKQVTRDFNKQCDDVAHYLEKHSKAEQNTSVDEEKFNPNTEVAFRQISSSIKLESAQVIASLDDSFKKLQSLTQINCSQSSAYLTLKNELLNVLDVKLPALLDNLIGVTDSRTQADLEKIQKEYAALETQEKPRLYQLAQLIVEKTTDAVTSLPCSSPPRALNLERRGPGGGSRWPALAGAAPRNLTSRSRNVLSYSASSLSDRLSVPFPAAPRGNQVLPALMTFSSARQLFIISVLPSKRF